MTRRKVQTLPEDQFDIIQSIRDKIAKKKLSQSRAANEIGISSSALSQFMSGQYAGSNDSVCKKVQTWITTSEEREEIEQQLPAAPDFIETPTAQKIMAALSYSQVAGDITIIYGSAGLGKTVASRQYAKSRSNVWVATMTPTTAGLGPCLYRVSEACGVRGAGGGRSWKVEKEIIDRISDTNGQIIIDEAQHLELRSIEALRGIHDATGIGLALVGNELVYHRITGGRRQVEFAQLFSRIGKRLRLTIPSQSDMDAMLTAWSITDKPAAKALIDIAKRPGGLRGVTKTLQLASMYATAKGDSVNAGHVRAAQQDLGGV